MDMEKVELDAAKNRASEEDGLIYSQASLLCGMEIDFSNRS